nr:2-amino-4-hydroxy-6-hydroxymethyldihydropteridine diphosphokinase [Eubacterium sp.]
TLYTPHELLDRLHEIENAEGRVRKEHWGPRTLDLDILFYDNEIIYDDDLVIPHPDLHNREFVLEPMCEIAPNCFHPLLKCSVAGLRKRLAGV